jgi:hypothetical protein
MSTRETMLQNFTDMDFMVKKQRGKQSNAPREAPSCPKLWHKNLPLIDKLEAIPEAPWSQLPHFFQLHLFSHHHQHHIPPPSHLDAARHSYDLQAAKACYNF